MHDRFIIAVIYLYLGMYAILLYMSLRNIKRYVIGLKRFKEFRITWFYMLAVTIIMLRVADNILIIHRNKTSKHQDHVDYHMWIVSYCDR